METSRQFSFYSQSSMHHARILRLRVLHSLADANVTNLVGYFVCLSDDHYINVHKNATFCYLVTTTHCILLFKNKEKENRHICHAQKDESTYLLLLPSRQKEISWACALRSFFFFFGQFHSLFSCQVVHYCHLWEIVCISPHTLYGFTFYTTLHQSFLRVCSTLDINIFKDCVLLCIRKIDLQL